MSHDLAKALDDQSIRFVRLLWCDNANLIRGKAFHTQFLAEHEQHGIGISMAQQAIPVMYDGVAANSGLGPVGEVWLKPDWSTLNALPYAVGHARVMADLTTREGKPWALCPRGFLRRMIADAAQMGFEIKAAFEHEFYLLRPDELSPADQTVFAATWAMDQHHVVIDAIADALNQQNIAVERYYPESGPGQHEIAIRYSDALQAADHQIAFRETVRTVALRHGLRASFIPKLLENAAGSGCHLHLSLWQNGINQIPNGAGELSPTAQAFVAALLQHLPALMALTTPSTNSYRRLKPHYWSGAFRCWGYDNREAAIRVPSNPTSPSPTHIELKTVDASANPYLALGGAIAAGLDGIRQRFTLPPAMTTDPGHLANEPDGAERLPETLADAIAQLRQSPLLLNALGSELAQAFLAVRQAEWEFFKEMSLADEAKILVERY